MRLDTKMLCTLAVMSALAFILVALIQIPLVPAAPFLRYEPKDVIIITAGFIYGPLAAFAIAVVVSFIEMITVSPTAYWGLLMNIISSTALCCTAAFIYKKKRTLGGALLGLIVGVLFATTIMMMWNYIVVPIFMGAPRAQVVPLLLPAFLPFNLISNSLNAALTLLLYKHVVKVLQVTRMMPPADTEKQKNFNLGIFIAALFVILTCVLWILILRGVF